ncbi:MAG TPA: hypothetical protein VKY44_05145 [Flavobacterium sp.]|nr:hypothetical protein [Flavobacterium sp.]
MKKLLVVLTIMMCTFVQAQKMKVTSGNFDFLKGETELNLVMDYSSMTFYKEKMDENAYIKKREKDILDSEKDRTEVENWKNDWEHSKKVTFVEKFLASMNKNSKRINTSENNAAAKYTLIVETVWIYPGWFGGVMKQPAKVSTLLKFVETTNPDTVLLEITSKNAPGDNFVGVPNNNDRIAEGYAKTGKSLAKMLSKKVKK